VGGWLLRVLLDVLMTNHGDPAEHDRVNSQHECRVDQE